MSLYAKTDMQHAVEDLDQLTEIMSRGGIPMQQAVATMLTQAGQYIRREKSFEGATVDTAPAPVDMKVAERTAGIMGRIMAFDTAREGTSKTSRSSSPVPAKPCSLMEASASRGCTARAFLPSCTTSSASTPCR